MPVVPRQVEHLTGTEGRHRATHASERGEAVEPVAAAACGQLHVCHRIVVLDVACRVRVQSEGLAGRQQQHMLAALELREEVVLRVEVARRAAAAVAGPQLARPERPRPCSAAGLVEPGPVEALLKLGLQCGQWRPLALAVLVDPLERRLQVVALALLAAQLRRAGGCEAGEAHRLDGANAQPAAVVPGEDVGAGWCRVHTELVRTAKLTERLKVPPARQACG